MPKTLTLKHNPTTITTPVYGVVGPSGTAWKVVNRSTVGYVGISLRSGGRVTNGATDDMAASSGMAWGAGVAISGAAGTVTNFGTLTGYFGVSLGHGGAVTNGAPGVKGASIQGSAGKTSGHPLSGYSIGVYIDGPGSVANFGAISGDGGVKVIGAPGTVTNFGTIDGGGIPAAGVDLDHGGTVINSGTAAISGFYGVYLRDGGVVTNGAAGSANASIHGLKGSYSTYVGTGVVSQYAAGTVTNFGNITGERGIDLRRGGAIANFGTIGGVQFAVELGHGGIVTNGAGGATRASILGLVEIAGVAGTVTNFGTISASGYGVELDHGGIVTNGAVGSTRALIKGEMKISGAAGTVKNFGSIAGGVILSGGTVTNGGTSTPNASMSAGVRIESYDGPKLPGTVTNFGSISNLGTTSAPGETGGYGVYLQAGGSVQNGLANFTRASIAGLSTAIDAGGGFATVTNFGAITGRSGVSLGGGGIITNGATSSTAASISGGVQVAHGRGALSNFGTIAGGASLSAGGSVTNGGAGTPGASITAGATGVAIGGAAGTVTNFGRISGHTGYGVSLLAAGAVTNEAGASIAGGGMGVGIGSGGTVTNFGAISSVYAFGVFLAGGGLVANGRLGATHATISGGAIGAKIGVGIGTVTNFGTISGHTGEGAYLAGGTVTNRAGAMIAGGRNGVFVREGNETVTNFGTISGDGNGGVFLGEGGVITNGGRGAAGAKISGGTAGVYGGGTIRVTNFGTISGHTGDGATLTAGAVTNNAGALIAGGTHGVYLEAGTLTNLGRIEGSQDGAYLGLSGGLITNGGPGSTSATISGDKTGVVIVQFGILRNFGTIIGAGGTAVQFTYLNDRLVVEPGAKFLAAAGKPGMVDGGRGSTLELAAKSSGALLLGTQFINFTTVIVDSGADWRVDVGLTSLAGETITGNGSNVLAFTDAGTFDLSAVRGFPTISLANTGPNALTLLNSNFFGVAGKVITVEGSSNSDTLSETGVMAADHAVLRGGAGDDTLVAGRNAALTGGPGKDLFVFTVPGWAATPDTNTIPDFAHGTDKIAFSEMGFGLGLAPVAATLFTANPTGSFTTPDQAFAYDTASGALYTRGAGSSQLLVATLAGHPTLTAGDITFVS